MTDDKLHEIELRTQKNSLDINHIVDRMDSYHFNHNTKLTKVQDKLDSLPTEDRIAVIFNKESEKLARGILKQVDEAKLHIKEQKDMIESLEKLREKDSGFISGAKWLLALIIAGLGAVGIKITF